MRGIAVSLALLIVLVRQMVHAERQNEKFDDRPWLHQKNCYATLPIPTNETIYHCTRPLPGLTCFGIPIDYVYVPSREALPIEYEVLRRFPKCWQAIGPMLCGIIYRPCAVFHTATRKSSEILHGKGEFWQRFNQGACKRVIEQCEDAVRMRLFPSELINCTRSVGNLTEGGRTWREEKNNTNGALARFGPYHGGELSTEWERQTFYTEDECIVPYVKENASQLEPMQCIFPLVHTDHCRIEPVIDNCYLSCRYPLISSHGMFVSFNIFRAMICFTMAATCLTIFLYLSCRSSIFVDSDAVFSIAFCLLSFSVYLLFWGAGSIPLLAQASECTLGEHGVAIRKTLLDSSWCFITAVVTHVSLLSSIGFLSMAYALRAVAATKAVARENEKEIRNSSSSSAPRFCLVIGVLIVSSSIGMISSRLNMMSNDGVSGVCSIGLHSITDHLLVVAAPGLLYCVIALSWGAWATWKERKLRNGEIEERIQEAIEQEKGRMKTRRSKGGHVAKEEDQEEQQCGEDEIVLLRGDEDEISDAQKRDISQRVRAELQVEWRDREQRACRGGISRKQTLVALCLCIYSLIFGLFVHFITLANNGSEETETVLKYVRCAMTQSILSKDLQWMHKSSHAEEVWANGTAEADPFVRQQRLGSDIDILSCSYPSTGGTRRMFGLLFIFFVLPLLPICVFIWSFIAGCAGVGGMPMVKKQRQSSKQSENDDVEMVGLTTERAEDSDRNQGMGLMDGQQDIKLIIEEVIIDQLVPREVVPSCPFEDDDEDVSSLSTMTRMIPKAVTSHPIQPLTLGRDQIRNAKAFIRRAILEADEQEAGLQQRLQLIQEELVLRSMPNDEEEPGSSSNQQQEICRTWEADLKSIHRILHELSTNEIYGGIARQAVSLIREANALANMQDDRGIRDYPFKTLDLLGFALECIDRLAYVIEQSIPLSPEISKGIKLAIEAIGVQMVWHNKIGVNEPEFEQMPHELEQLLGGLPYSLDVHDPIRIQQRSELWKEGMTDEERKERLAQMLAGTNGRYKQLMAKREAEAAAAAAASAAAPFYSAFHPGFWMLQNPAMGLPNPFAKKIAAPNPTASSFASDVMYANPACQLLAPSAEAGPSRDFVEPASDNSNNAPDDGEHDHEKEEEDDDEDATSSEQSSDSMGLNAVTAVRHTVDAGGYGVTVVDIHRPASKKKQGTTFPIVSPGFSRLYTPSPRQQGRGAANSATCASASAATTRTHQRQQDAAAKRVYPMEVPKLPEDTFQLLTLIHAPNIKLKWRTENQKKKIAVAVLAEGSASRRCRTEADELDPPTAAAVNDEAEENVVESSSTSLPEDFGMLMIDGDGAVNEGIPQDESHSKPGVAMAEAEDEEEEEDTNMKEQDQMEEGEDVEEEDDVKVEEEAHEGSVEEEAAMEEEKVVIEDEHVKREKIATISEARDKYQADRDSGIIEDEDVAMGGSRSDVSIASLLPNCPIEPTIDAEETLQLQ